MVRYLRRDATAIATAMFKEEAEKLEMILGVALILILLFPRKSE